MALTLSACGKQIEQFVKDGVKAPIDNLDPIASTASSKALKISPGAGLVKGTQVQARLTITMTDRTIKGSQVDAKVSVNQTRVE